MIDVFLEPMFESSVQPFGFPLDAMIVALGLVGVVTGFLWIRRITHVDPDPRIFRATTHPDPTDVVLRPVIAAAVAFIVVLALGLAAGI